MTAHKNAESRQSITTYQLRVSTRFFGLTTRRRFAQATSTALAPTLMEERMGKQVPGRDSEESAKRVRGFGVNSTLLRKGCLTIPRFRKTRCLPS